MRCLLLGGVLALGVGVALGAQFLDTQVTGLPCAVSSTAVAADSAGTIRTLVFTCQDGRVWLRNVPTHRPGPTIPGPYTDPFPSCPGLSPFPGGLCQDGGWLPVGHPARRR